MRPAPRISPALPFSLISQAIEPLAGYPDELGSTPDGAGGDATGRTALADAAGGPR